MLSLEFPWIPMIPSQNRIQQIELQNYYQLLPQPPPIIDNSMTSFVILVALLAVSLIAQIHAIDNAEIILAVQNGDMGKLEWLLNEGINPDYFDPNGDRWTALIHAVVKGNTETVDRLLRARANPNQAERDGWTPLHFASAYGYITIARSLLEAGADVTKATPTNVSPFELAKEYSKWDVLETLEAARQSNSGHNADKVARIYQANLDIQFGTPQRITAENEKFFELATKGPNDALQKYLVEKRPNVNAKSAGDARTALHRAALAGDVDRIKMLVESGAYVNELDVNSWSALMFAASNVSDCCMLG